MIVLIVKAHIYNSVNKADKTTGKLCEILGVHVPFEPKDTYWLCSQTVLLG